MDEKQKWENKWFGGEKIENVNFNHNDSIEFIDGENIGEKGSVVSVYFRDNRIFYIIESESGKDIEVKSSKIKLLIN